LKPGQVQELIEGTLFVAAECAAFDETILAIELESGLESGARASLQREAGVTSLAGLGDDVIENRRSNTPS
jgi:hypothetical protein